MWNKCRYSFDTELLLCNSSSRYWNGTFVNVVSLRNLLASYIKSNLFEIIKFYASVSTPFIILPFRKNQSLLVMKTGPWKPATVVLSFLIIKFQMKYCTIKKLELHHWGDQVLFIYYICLFSLNKNEYRK